MVFVGSKFLRVVAFGTGKILQGDVCMKNIASDRRANDDRRSAPRGTGKGRRAGEEHPNAVLTNAEVELVRQLREVDGLTYAALAAKFEISKSSIAKICQYQRR